MHFPQALPYNVLDFTMYEEVVAMYKKILLPIDGSELSLAAVSGITQFAILAQSEVILLTVTEPFNYTAVNEFRPESIDDYDERMLAIAQDRLTEARQILEDYDIPVKTITLKNFSPAEAILDAAKAHQCDCIWMASHGRKGFAAVVLGSETQKVLSQAPVPVMVFR